MALLGIQVKGILETLDYILEHNASVVRFGDGEIEMMSGYALDYQPNYPHLTKRMKEIIQQESNPQCVICVSDIFERVNRYVESTISFYQWHLSRNALNYQNLCRASWYGSTFISRPYMDLVDKSISSTYFDKLKQLWEGRDLLIVEGELTRSGVGNDLFANAGNILRIVCPSRNAYAKINEINRCILENVMANGKPRLVLLMLGPTAKLLAYDLSSRFQCLDIGHLDCEYEWFKRGVTEKIKLLNKHTAEFNLEHEDAEVVLEDDPVYNAQIIARII